MYNRIGRNLEVAGDEAAKVKHSDGADEERKIKQEGQRTLICG